MDQIKNENLRGTRFAWKMAIKLVHIYVCVCVFVFMYDMKFLCMMHPCLKTVIFVLIRHQCLQSYWRYGIIRLL